MRRRGIYYIVCIWRKNIKENDGRREREREKKGNFLARSSFRHRCVCLIIATPAAEGPVHQLLILALILSLLSRLLHTHTHFNPRHIQRSTFFFSYFSSSFFHHTHTPHGGALLQLTFASPPVSAFSYPHRTPRRLLYKTCRARKSALAKKLLLFFYVTHTTPSSLIFNVRVAISPLKMPLFAHFFLFFL